MAVSNYNSDLSTATCENHELTEKVSEHRFQCPYCGQVEDIRSTPSSVTASARPIDRGRPQK